ncbi:hypothetical protein [Acinetobacter johnsonii]|uniref:hypothetical protein n=1 Tax=Acinetobacter johnsonii TaxID=40214 RepID=UPI001F2AA314|nr:hypothetical protein [Acinetobacter johnsonii]
MAESILYFIKSTYQYQAKDEANTDEPAIGQVIKHRGEQWTIKLSKRHCMADTLFKML